ncbi:MAG TPA: M23 family metallopeptidase [Anaerovoracaceae bacterium]|nr:M23 family metallopeptidase [Anaerovoracaceae bacterium]
MKDTRRPGTEKIYDFWKGLTSGIIDKADRKRKNISDMQNKTGDMGVTHTPISRLDLTGMNREQAKELIGRIIDEKLEMISRIELAEPEIDYTERERLRAKAEERISKRRNRRKRRHVAAPAETVVMEQIVFSDINETEKSPVSLNRMRFEQASVFDVIQPESFPFEQDKPAEEEAATLIEEQLSILDSIPAEKTEVAMKAAASEIIAASSIASSTVPAAASAASSTAPAAAIPAAFAIISNTDSPAVSEVSLAAVSDASPAAIPEASFAVTEDAPVIDRAPNILELLQSKANLFTTKFINSIKSLKKGNPADDPDPDIYQPHGYDLFGIFPYKSDQEADRKAALSEAAAGFMAAVEFSTEVVQAAEVSAAVTAVTPAQTEEISATATVAAASDKEISTIATLAGEVIGPEPFAAASLRVRIREEGTISTSLDEAVDKVFAFYEGCREKLLLFIREVSLKTSEVVKERLLPAAASGMRRVNGRLTPLLQRAESRFQLKNKAGIILAAVSEKEKKISGKMARFVDFIDRINETFLRSMATVRDKTCLCNDRIRDFAERHKKQILIEFGAFAVVAAVVTLSIGNATAYEYVYNGKVLGVVKNQEDVYKTIDIIGDKLSVQYDADIIIDKEKDIRFNKIVAMNQEIDDQEDILNRLTYMSDMKANGKGIYVDGQLTAILESEKTARDILQEVQNEFLKTDPNIHYEKIGFAENIVIQDVETKLGSIEGRDAVLEYLMTGAMEQKIHVVQSGETFSEIAKMYGKKQNELAATNPDVVPEKLHIGQEISLNQIVPLITVQTTEIAQYKEEIPFDITYENTAALYKNEQTVKSRGANGEKDVVAEIVRNNGLEVSRNEISANVLSEPVSQVVLVGTKEPPPLIGTGTFIYPIRGTLTSRYGTRWGRLHAGIDLAAPIGTHIKAADGGVVTFSGYNGQLGYMVAIDHGGGRVTWYGHCSKLMVEKGDKVYQGQHIANVGNTGRSTGPHLHFEVHINGNTKNPLNYL